MSLKKVILSYIWSVVVYGSEVWTINIERQNSINEFICWMYHMVLTISLTDRVSNRRH